MLKKSILALLAATSFFAARAQKEEFSPVDYVNPLVGTQSSFELSTGNTYPAIARPWGMNFWTPQTGEMGNGWQYVYTDNKIRGFKQTHQPSPWINDFGQFSLMPVVGAPKFDQNERASWFSHKGEEAKAYYYKVYLAEHDVVVELSPGVVPLHVPRVERFVCGGRRFRPRLAYRGRRRQQPHYGLHHAQQRRSAPRFQELFRR